jgi:3-dehydroquinate synthase
MPQPTLGAKTSLTVPLGARSYEIVVTSGQPESFGGFARAALDASWAGKHCRLALLVTDENLDLLPYPRACGEALEQLGIRVQSVVLPAGEATKCLNQASRLYDGLVAARADRHTAIVAVGGGVVGDLAGFVAATYARGLPLLMVPTSLLAQVDSAVGGKVGINHPLAKNIIGAFHQPSGVWIDTATLGTLPPRELRCGLAEVVKYGVILDAAFFAFLEARTEAILERQDDALRQIVARSCQLKADVVASDEREETGGRAVLNFGHTVGHAIEAVAGYGGRYLHGEAVAAGMVAECRIAERLGWITPDVTGRLVALLSRLGLPTATPGLDPASLLEAMTRDKKNQRGQVRFVLPRALGHVELTGDVGSELMRLVVSELCAEGDGGRAVPSASHSEASMR